jgi:hypothetical protein
VLPGSAQEWTRFWASPNAETVEGIGVRIRLPAGVMLSSCSGIFDLPAGPRVVVNVDGGARPETTGTVGTRLPVRRPGREALTLAVLRLVRPGKCSGMPQPPRLGGTELWASCGLPEWLEQVGQPGPRRVFRVNQRPAELIE